mmetsp:Transcript_128124/g.370916  ORF Transcript_128124/g.370916 Transcript_128124/m.370916 type:complete len:225 (+) Transcript_128124:483-1157(+)
MTPGSLLQVAQQSRHIRGEALAEVPHDFLQVVVGMRRGQWRGRPLALGVLVRRDQRSCAYRRVDRHRVLPLCELSLHRRQGVANLAHIILDHEGGRAVVVHLELVHLPDQVPVGDLSALLGVPEIEKLVKIVLVHFHRLQHLLKVFDLVEAAHELLPIEKPRPICIQILATCADALREVRIHLALLLQPLLGVVCRCLHGRLHHHGENDVQYHHADAHKHHSEK